jgi:hypothetical protein
MSQISSTPLQRGLADGAPTTPGAVARAQTAWHSHARTVRLANRIEKGLSPG